MGQSQYDHILVPFQSGETSGFTVTRVADGQPVGFPRGGGGLYIFQAKGVSNYRPALQKGAYDPGQPITLVAEPENPHDAHAISIWDRNRKHKVGYVSRGNAEKLSPCLQEGAKIRGYVLRIDRWKGGRAHLHVLIVDMGQASIDLPEDPSTPIAWAGPAAKAEGRETGGCFGVLAFLVAASTAAAFSLVRILT